MASRALFEYFIRIDHMVVYPESYDVAATSNNTYQGNYPGVTNVTVALEDSDGHFVHSPPVGGFGTWGDHTDKVIVVNWWTDGGIIEPAYSTFVPGNITDTVNFTADTNARTIMILCDANIPSIPGALSLPAPALNLEAWSEITTDGINSVLDTSGVVTHLLTYGYIDQWAVTHSFNTCPEPPLPPELGGPIPDLETPPWKLNGPIIEVSIPLYAGCNLISSPVYLFLNNLYWSSAWPTSGNGGYGIPMDVLFGMTAATETIEAIWWCTSTGWKYYIPGHPDSTAYFNDGVGYWIKAEKPCTLELSGVEMENAPFLPAEYTVHPSWNLVGFTSIHEMATSDYFESLSANGINFYGPIWIYDAQWGAWTRDPANLWPGFGIWMYYKHNSLLTTPEIAP